MDNARRYATHTVVIECAAVAGTIRITVTDDGPGIPRQLSRPIPRRPGPR
ncbi:hypothetical protein [Streptomyces sp. NPDC056244]